MNIVLVVSDTFRYDNLSCYGPTQVKTPRLDQFAQEAFVFDNAYLGSYPTVPYRLDVMNGRFSFIDTAWCPLPPETVTLQQILSASGLTSMMIVDNPHLLESGFNYSRGFDGWEWIRGQETDFWKTAPKELELPKEPHKFRSMHATMEKILRNSAWWQCEEDRYAPRTIKAACEWLDDNQDQDQFYLYIDLFDPHEPWDAPQKYIDMYDPSYEGEHIIYPQYNFWREFLTEEELDHIRALYMAESTMVDHWFGVLLDKIEELGLTEDTAVIFVSDHGYLFGEHDILGKSLLPDDGRFIEFIPLYDEIRRTPLLIRLPDQSGGQHISALAQGPDLMPTMLEMAGLIATEAMGGQAKTQALQCGVFYTETWEFNPENIHGTSLMPLMRGETDRLRDIAVCSASLIHHTPYVARSAIVTEDGWCLHYAGKYEKVQTDITSHIQQIIGPESARTSVAPELYYLPDDPREMNNVFDANESLAREIHERHVRWLEEAGTPDEHLAGRRHLR
jgi:arylsulfatase A-like enzyme